MESTEVIDIDELLGDAPKEGSEDPEEYDFEGFLDGVLINQTGQESDHNPQPRQKSLSRGETGDENGEEQAFSSTSNQEGKSHSNQGAFKQSSGNHSNSKKDTLSPEQSRTAGGGRISLDGKMTPNTQQEALLDVLSLGSAIQNDSSDGLVSEDDLVIDVNSEELKQFILEFQEESNKSVATIRTRSQGPQGQRDDDSLSSLSTCESHDDSLSSSLASGDIHISPDRVKLSKAAKGKSVRFLMSSLLNKTRAQQEMQGSEDESKKDAKKNKVKSIKKKEEKPRTTPSPRKETSSSAEKLRQILGEGDWEKKLKINGLPNSTTMQVKAEDTPPKESSLPKQALQAAAKGDQQILEFLLLANRELSVVRDGRGNTLLHTVCKRGHLDCLRWLATGFCSGLLTMENDDCFTPADLAVKHGQLECVSWLVQETECKCELHPQDNRWSLLHVAARFGQERCLRWLLGHMQVADIPLELIDHNDNTPAHLAAKYGHLNCLQTLVEFNADITMINKKKQTPCILATKYHHEMCAQFLVVVETCVTLSSQVMTLQRQLRESHEDRRVLKHKLKNTLSCTEALVKMHKATDTLEKVQQVRQEYVDLTNLLVKRLDDIHLEQKALEANGNDDTAKLEEVSETKRKAAELEQACQNLLEEEEKRRQGDHSNRLQEIEDQLGNIEVPKSPRASWVSPMMDDPTHMLDHMRTRLSEVSHGLAVQGPSLSEESVDNLSLSSSYASSLSSSCSSLTTLMRSSGSLRGSRRRKVTWTDEVGHIREVVAMGGTQGHKSISSSGNNLLPPPPYVRTPHRPQLQRQRANTNQPASSPDTEISSTSSSPLTKPRIHPLVQYDRSCGQDFKLQNVKKWSSSADAPGSEAELKEKEESDCDSRCSSIVAGKPCSNCENGCGTEDSDSGDSKCDVTMASGRSSGTVRRGDGVDLLVSSQSQAKQGHYDDNPMEGRLDNHHRNSKPDRTNRTNLSTDDFKSLQRTKSESDVPSGNSDWKLSVRVEIDKQLNAKSSADEILQGWPSPPEQFKKDTVKEQSDKGEEDIDTLSDSSEDEDDPFGSGNVRAMQEAMKNMRPAPIVEKMGNSTENLHQLFAKHLPPHKYDMLKNVPDYMRKVQRTNEHGQSQRAVVKIDGEEDVIIPSQDVADKRGQTLKRINSDSSASSTSSDAPWSESDQQESPAQERRSRRSGILNTGKKSGDGKKSKSEKHITFAPDTEMIDKESQGRKIAISKRRDLSPIYETPDLLRLSRNGGSALRQNVQTNSEVHHTDSANNNKSDSGKTLEERLYRLFSYSSDDDYESSCNSEESANGGHVARKDQHRAGMRLPPGLSDEISAEFEGISDDPTSRDINANGPRMWYDSSEEEEEEDDDDNSHSLQNSTGSFDRHICYL